MLLSLQMWSFCTTRFTYFHRFIWLGLDWNFFQVSWFSIRCTVEVLCYWRWWVVFMKSWFGTILLEKHKIKIELSLCTFNWCTVFDFQGCWYVFSSPCEILQFPIFYESTYRNSVIPLFCINSRDNNIVSTQLLLTRSSQLSEKKASPKFCKGCFSRFYADTVLIRHV